MRKMKLMKQSKMGIVLLCAAMLSACGSAATQTEGNAASETAVTSNAVLTTAEAQAAAKELANVTVKDLVDFDEVESTIDLNSGNVTRIQMNGTKAEVSGTGAKAGEGVVTITAAGTYVLNGKFTDGQVVVEAPDDEDVTLVLNGANIYDSNSAPIYIKEADKVMVWLQEGTENIISDGTKYVLADEAAEEPNAAIFSKADLVIGGTGKLSVSANYNDGITSKDDLKIISGTIEVQAKDDGIIGRDLVAVKDGNIVVKAGGDGMKSTNDTDSSKGFIALASGTFDIQAGSDGLQAETQLVVDGGTYNIITGGGHENGEVKVQEEGRGGPWGGDMTTPPDAPSAAPQTGQSTEAGQPAKTNQTAQTTQTTSQTETTDETAESQSAKALKASGNIIVNDGRFTLNSADDAIHGNSNVAIVSGEIDITSGDDGIHADSLTAINGGYVNITKSYEGIEGADITINGGEIHVTASDDGVNVNGGNDESSVNGRPGQNEFSASASGTNMLTISGGALTVDAAGDGLDANGSIQMSGGNVVVYGPTSSGNGTLDYDGSFVLSGGLLAAAGSSGMAQAPSDTSSQYSVAMNYTQTQKAGTIVHLEDSKGNEIMTFAPSKDYQTVVISTPDLQQGSYVLYTGGTSSGSEMDGVYNGGQYTGGTKVVAFEISDSKTTWLSETGVTEGNPAGGHGMGGGGMAPGGAAPGGMRPRGTRPDGTVPPEGASNGTAPNGTAPSGSTSEGSAAQGQIQEDTL